MGLQLSQRSPIPFNMKACILLFTLAVAVQAQKFEPAKCDYEKQEMMCPGTWDPKTGEQTTADYCIPMKVGDCYNHCPVDCGKDMMCPGKMDPKGCAMPDTCNPGKFCPVDCDWEKEMMCPGKTHADGCRDAEFCVPGKFCPVDCDWEKEMMCSGMWDPETGEQMSADYCTPMKVGDCYNHCPLDCGKDMMCPGGMDPKGCPMPDICFPAGKDCPKM